MDSEKVLSIVEQLLQKQLTQIEQRVLILSWEGQSYKDIEENTGYVIGYLRDIGSGLWKELSDVLQKRVTKKNLSLIIEQFQKNPILPSIQNIQRESEQQLIQDSQEATEDTILNDYSFPSAPVPYNSRLYIKRPPCEELARKEITRPGCLLRIKAPPKMGKSSLLNQVVARANSLGYRVAYLDFRDAEAIVFRSIDSLLQWLCLTICQQLNLHPNLDYYWDEDMGSKISSKIFLETYILEQTKYPLVLIINEINLIFEYPSVARDFLPLLRSFHEQSCRSAAWQKLRLVLAYSTDIYIPFNINQSPFNVGLSIKLPFFNRQQVLDLIARYGLEDRIAREDRLMELLGGHPYLINLALYYLEKETLTIEQLLQDAATPSGIYAQHLQNYLILLQKDTRLISAMKQIVTSNEPIKLDAIIAYKLASMGLISLNGFFATYSCRLYQLYFTEVLFDRNY